MTELMKASDDVTISSTLDSKVCSGYTGDLEGLSRVCSKRLVRIMPNSITLNLVHRAAGDTDTIHFPIKSDDRYT